MKIDQNKLIGSMEIEEKPKMQLKEFIDSLHTPKKEIEGYDEEIYKFLRKHEMKNRPIKDYMEKV